MKVDLAQMQLNSPEVSQDVYPIYGALRESGGILWSQRHNAWLVSSYEKVRRLLLAEESSVDKLAPYMSHTSGVLRDTVADMNTIMHHWLPFIDPPEHTRLRSILQKDFSPRVVHSHEPMIRQVVVDVLDGLAGRSEIEFLDEFAFQVPALVITELYGLPRAEVGRIKVWAEGIAELVLGSANPDRHENSAATMREMKRYFEDIAAARLAALTEGREPATDSLLDKLLLARLAPEGLTDEEVVSTMVLILFAAPETTASMLVNAMVSLTSDKPKLRELVESPDLIGPAIDEMIRHEGPVPAVVRVARDDIQVDEHTIRAGQRIFLLLKSANRDPAQFPNPDVLDFGRVRRPHVGFGSGIHLCLGAALARLEGRVALEELFRRYGDFDLVEPEIVWRHELLAHSPHSLRIAMTERQR